MAPKLAGWSLDSLRGENQLAQQKRLAQGRKGEKSLKKRKGHHNNTTAALVKRRNGEEEEVMMKIRSEWFRRGDYAADVGCLFRQSRWTSVLGATSAHEWDTARFVFADNTENR